jgi:predicted deacetylase
MKTGPFYLVRFDDICPTMNWRVWDEIEGILVRNQVRPILAVVPDNRDSALMADAPRADFWDRVRQWQSWGWTIALHGYQHIYVNRNPGLVGIKANSEFAGLPRPEQERKLRAGMAIFQKEGIGTETWVAPSHSFDETTLDLLKLIGIRIISDGFTPVHFLDRRGMVWIPCQQWDRIRPVRAGVRTLCIHHNPWSGESVDWFSRSIQAHRPRIVGVDELLASYPPAPLSARGRVRAWGEAMWKFRLRRAVKRVIRWHPATPTRAQ